ncbi:hypothetical protein PG993_014113 [Apiospora rasikravindrae]|uniref:Rhodopsin domain-containing protein n=1 Tax=Apiospora rasikravindrae TaxID=990691 RepID=A0ABR1RSC2_9PEZI
MDPVPKPDVTVIATSWTFAALGTIFFALRIWCRKYRVGILWWDDLVLGVSLIFVILSAAFTTAMFREGWSDTPVPRGRPVVFYLACGSCGAIAAAFGKTAYAMTLLRLTTDTWKRRLIWFFATSLNLVLWFGAVAVWCRFCEESPRFLSGGPYLPGRCWPEPFVVKVITFATIYLGASHLILALFPWAIVHNLQMQKKHKLGISTSMSAGALTFGSNVVMLHSIFAILQTAEDNLTYSLAFHPVYFVGGPAISIIAQVVPVLRALFTNHDLKPKEGEKGHQVEPSAFRRGPPGQE